jgi:hypothetical protein
MVLYGRARSPRVVSVALLFDGSGSPALPSTLAVCIILDLEYFGLGIVRVDAFKKA